MQITIHRGTHEIGGNCVEVRSGAHRIILDVGMPLVDSKGQPFESKALRGKSVRQLLDEGILPRVPGLFADPSDKTPSPEAILLSHSHTDHVGLIPYTRPGIDVYLSEGTSKMLLAGSMFAAQKDIDRDRKRDVTVGKAFAIGDFKITAYNVDHSAYDSLAFIIEAEGKRVLYSGDMRLHGRKPGMAKRLTRAAKGRIDLALMEGTHAEASGERLLSEQDLEDQIADQIKDSPGIALANFSPMHVDRLVTFFRAAKKTKRTFVADAYTAWVLYLIQSKCGVPDPRTCPLVKVYYPQAFLKTYRRKNQQCVFDKFQHKRIGMEELAASPGQFVMVFRPTMIAQDFGGKLPEGSCCIYSYWPGYLERPSSADFEQEVAAAGGQFLKAHTSGHIFAEDTATFLGEIGPKMVIPIHTFQPEAFERLGFHVPRLNDGESYEVP